MKKHTKKRRSFVSSGEKARELISNYLKKSGENQSSLSKKVGIDPPSVYNFMNGKSSMTFRTFEKIERFIHEQNSEQ